MTEYTPLIKYPLKMAANASNEQNLNPFEQNKNEIAYNVINSLLAGALVFTGALTSGEITLGGVSAAVITSLILIITKFKEYWSTQEEEYCRKQGFFNLI